MPGARASVARLWEYGTGAMGIKAVAPDRLALSDADQLFATLDRRVIGEDVDRWVAAVLRIYGDEQDWWIDVATTTDASVSVVLRLSRRATAAHALAALHEWRPSHGSPVRVVNVMRRC